MTAGSYKRIREENANVENMQIMVYKNRVCTYYIMRITARQSIKKITRVYVPENQPAIFKPRIDACRHPFHHRRGRQELHTLRLRKEGREGQAEQQGEEREVVGGNECTARRVHVPVIGKTSRAGQKKQGEREELIE